MIPLPTGVRVWLATGYTDMRKGFASLSLQVQEVLRRDPLSGHLFCFRGRRGNLLKVIWHDGQGACLFTKRLERGRFLWPSAADGAVTISPGLSGILCAGPVDHHARTNLSSNMMANWVFASPHSRGDIFHSAAV